MRQLFLRDALVPFVADPFYTCAEVLGQRSGRVMTVALDYLEQLRDPRRGAGLDEYEICGGRAELGKSQRLPFFSEARSPDPLDF